MTELQRKAFTPTNAKADTPGAISAEFATLNVPDRDGDITLPGAFGEQHVRIQSHGHDTHGWTIGKGVISEVGNKAVLDGLLNLDMTEGREGHASLRFDLAHGSPLQEWSYVFEIIKAHFGTFQGEEVRFLDELKVHSVDPVFLGAGIATRTTAVKSAVSAVELSPSEKGQLDLIKLRRQYEGIKADQRPAYVEVPADEIPTATQRVCGYVLDQLKHRLPEPDKLAPLRWYKAASPAEREELKKGRLGGPPALNDFKGYGGLATKSGDIWLQSPRDVWQTAVTLCHEIGHQTRLQKQANPKRWEAPEPMTAEEEEAFADEFAVNAMNSLEADIAAILEG